MDLRLGKREPSTPKSKMSESKCDYEVGRGKPPVHSRFKKGQSGNPRGPRPKNLPALLIEALNEMVIDTLKDAEKKAGVAPPPEPAPFTAADKEVMATFIARLRQSWEEELREKGMEPG